MKMYSNLDLVTNSLQNVRLDPKASDPASPLEGEAWFNTTTHTLKVKDDTSSRTVLTDKLSGAASGIATLDGSTKVVQDPASASITATTSGIPKASAGKIANGWLNDISSQAATNAPSTALAMNNQKITGLATPTADTDAATKGYVDTAVQGLDPKASVKCATTGNITLSDTQTIDGVSVIAGDRVLVKDQTTTANNGIYVVAAGAWTRATDADTWAELVSAYCFVEQGTANADKAFICTVDSGGTLNTTAVTWVTFSSSAQVYPGSGIPNSTGSAWGTSYTTSGSGSVALTTSPSFTTPLLGAATATSINKLTITAPAASSTLTIADGKTLTANRSITLTGTDGTSLSLAGNLTTSGAFATTLTSTADTNVTLPTTGTLATLAGTETLTNKTLTSATLIGPNNKISRMADGLDVSIGAASLSGQVTSCSGGAVAIGAGVLPQYPGSSTGGVVAVGTEVFNLLNSVGNDYLTAVGYKAAHMVQGAYSYNTVIGAYVALVGITSTVPSAGTHNTLVGFRAGMAATNEIHVAASSCTLIGAETQLGGPFNNATVIGYGVTADASNKVIIGNTSVTSTILRGAVTATSFNGLSGKYATNLSTSATSYTITHSLGTKDVTVNVYRIGSPYDQILCDVEMTSTTQITLRFATAPAADTYRVVVIG